MGDESPGSDPEPGDDPAFEPQPVADLFEAEGVRQLHKHHRRQMPPDRVVAGVATTPCSRAAASTMLCGIYLGSFSTTLIRWRVTGANGGEVVVIGIATPIHPPATPPNFTPTRRTLSLSCGMPVNAKIESKMTPEFNDSKIHAILCTARHLRYPANVQFWHITFLSHVLTCA
jgi:hypothetical protein